MALPDWSARSLPARVTLPGARVRLEPLTASAHADDLWSAIASEPDVQAKFAHWNVPPPASKEELLARCKRFEALETRRKVYFAIVTLEENKASGHLSLASIDAANGSVMLGAVYFGPKLMRTAAATEAFYVSSSAWR